MKSYCPTFYRAGSFSLLRLRKFSSYACQLFARSSMMNKRSSSAQLSSNLLTSNLVYRFFAYEVNIV